MSKVISLGQILFLDLPYEITVDNKISTAAQEDLQLYQFGASVSHLWCLSVSPLVPHCLIYYQPPSVLTTNQYNHHSLVNSEYTPQIAIS